MWPLDCQMSEAVTICTRLLFLKIILCEAERQLYELDTNPFSGLLFGIEMELYYTVLIQSWLLLLFFFQSLL